MKETEGALNPIAPEIIVGLLPDGARIIDIGCGEGSLLQCLEKNGRLPVGAEPDADRALRAAQNCPNSVIVSAKAEKLPFPANSFEAAIMECTFSLCEPEETVKELFRVLVPGGTAIITDIYARGKPTVLEKSCMLRNIYSKDALEAFFNGNFILADFEDHARELAELFAQMILNDTACSCVAPEERDVMRSARPGYGIWLWKKR